VKSFTHIPWAYPDGTGFGHHYVTQDRSLRTAEQFDIAVFPGGDKSRAALDPLRDQPHVRIRIWDSRTWQDVSFTPITAPLTTAKAE